MTDNRKKGRAGSVLRTIILVIALGVFCFSAYKLITIYLDYKQGSDEYTALEKYADLQNQVEPEIPEDEEEPDYRIVRTKRFAMKPMTPEEAVLQMNLLNHEFFAFKNQDADNAFSVVYKRKNGGYGLIESDES